MSHLEIRGGVPLSGRLRVQGAKNSVLPILAAALLAPRIGLAGVWLAMCGELCFRGVLFLIRLLRERWLDRKVFG